MFAPGETFELELAFEKGGEAEVLVHVEEAKRLRQAGPDRIGRLAGARAAPALLPPGGGLLRRRQRHGGGQVG